MKKARRHLFYIKFFLNHTYASIAFSSFPGDSNYMLSVQKLASLALNNRSLVFLPNASYGFLMCVVLPLGYVMPMSHLAYVSDGLNI